LIYIDGNKSNQQQLPLQHNLWCCGVGVGYTIVLDVGEPREPHAVF
jgi:hypothetical protein